MVCVSRVVSLFADIVATEMTLPFLGGNNLTVPGWCPVKKGIGTEAGTGVVIAPSGRHEGDCLLEG